MAKDDDVSIFDELDSRLDDFFAEEDQLFSDEDEGENITDSETSEEVETSAEQIEAKDENPPDTAPAYENTPVDKDAPLNQLKAIVLEMDWEISDENLTRYLSEINRLINNFRNDRPIYLFFKLHAAIGKYMLSKKAHAHPDALKFLYSVYNSLEKAIISDIPLLEKNRLILSEVNNFKQLKNKLFPDFVHEPDSSDNMPEVNEGSDSMEGDISETASGDNNFDISSLPETIQKGINEYIEKSIAEKLESIKKELQHK